MRRCPSLALLLPVPSGTLAASLWIACSSIWVAKGGDKTTLEVPVSPEGWGQSMLVILLDPAECLVHGSHSVSQGGGLSSSLGQGRTDGPFLTPAAGVVLPTSCAMLEIRIAQALPLTRGTGLGWDGVSAFALNNANGCWWILGQELPCLPQSTLGIPCTYTACMIIHRSKLQTPYLTTLKAAPATLCPKSWRD